MEHGDLGTIEGFRREMRSTRFFFLLIFLIAGVLAQAAPIAGTVTDKTTGKPAAGDQVVMLDVQAGMNEVAHATTDAKGHYSLNGPGDGPYLVRVTHQGAGYFIAAPPGGGSGDIPVYDVAAKVQGVRIEADVIEAESDNGQLKVNERYFVHNTSVPPITQWSPKSFEVVLPPGAVLAGAGGQRPGGLPTSINLEPAGAPNHYAFNFPIQPDDGDKDTMFQISYAVPYPDGRLAFQSVLTLPSDNVAVLLPKSMTFTPGADVDFKTVNEDPNVQTFLMRNVAANKQIDFTISGEGAIPREAQGGGQSGGPGGGQGPQAAGGSTPGGGIGEPIDTPDPLSKYKWWILGAIALLLATVAAFLLRRPGGAVTGAPVHAGAPYDEPAAASYAPAGGKNALLNALKEELFAIESEKIAGTLSAEDYAEQKAALETVLKRALKKQ
jgi:hypothetical protein